MDLFKSVRLTNLRPMLDVGVNNFNLVRYLITQLRQSDEDRLRALHQFFPEAQSKDWNLAVAGQRVQIIKRTPKGGRLQLGTEVVTSVDGSLAALLGASPGASTAVSIMLEVLVRCWGEQLASDAWMKRLRSLLPSYGCDIRSNLDQLNAMRQRSNAALSLMTKA